MITHSSALNELLRTLADNDGKIEVLEFEYADEVRLGADLGLLTSCLVAQIQMEIELTDEGRGLMRLPRKRKLLLMLADQITLSFGVKRPA